MSLDELNKQIADGSQKTTDDSTADEDDGGNVPQYPSVRVVGTVLVAYEELLEVRFQDFLDDRDGNPKTDQDLQFAFTVKNPTVVKGSVFENVLRNGDVDLVADIPTDERGEGQSADYKIIDTEDPNVELTYDASGTAKGVKGLRTKEFEATEVEGIGEDVVRIYVGGLSGRAMARALDVNGGPYARFVEQDDGTWINNRGLIEGHPDRDSGQYPRLARYPQVRPDVEGVPGFLYRPRRRDVEKGYNEEDSMQKLQYFGYAYTNWNVNNEDNWDDDGEPLPENGTELSPTWVALEDVQSEVEWPAKLAWDGNKPPEGAAIDTDDGSDASTFDLGDGDEGNEDAVHWQNRAEVDGLMDKEKEFGISHIQHWGMADPDDVYDDFSKTIDSFREKNVGEDAPGSLPNNVSEERIRDYIEQTQPHAPDDVTDGE